MVFPFILTSTLPKDLSEEEKKFIRGAGWCGTCMTFRIAQLLDMRKNIADSKVRDRILHEINEKSTREHPVKNLFDIPKNGTDSDSNMK